MGLEDEVRARQQERNSRSERDVRGAQEAQKELDKLITEFSVAVAERPDLARIPVYDCIRVEHSVSSSPYSRGPRYTFHPKRTLVGSGWLFHPVKDYGDSTSSSNLVLMDDEKTLTVPHMPTVLSRRGRRFGPFEIPGTAFWPKGDFVCWGGVYEVPAIYSSGDQVAAIRAGMINFLDR